MTDIGLPELDETSGLYVGWEELRRRVAPRVGRDRFRTLVKLKQEKGFPPFRDDWGGFYWPRVKEWLDSDNGVGADVRVAQVEDGPENFDATPRTRPRAQARPAPPAVLARQPGHAGPDGVSRHLHPVASGRDR